MKKYMFITVLILSVFIVVSGCIGGSDDNNIKTDDNIKNNNNIQNDNNNNIQNDNNNNIQNDNNNNIQNDNNNDYLEKVKEYSKKGKNGIIYTCKLTMESNDGQVNVIEYTYKVKENKYYYSNDQMIMCSDGEYLYTYIKDSNIYTKMKLDSSDYSTNNNADNNNNVEDINNKNYLSIFENIDNTFKYIGKEKVNNIECKVYMGKHLPDKEYVKIWVDNNGIVRKYSVKNPEGTMTMEFKNVKIENIDDSEFVLKPPAGAKIIDYSNLEYNNYGGAYN